MKITYRLSLALTLVTLVLVFAGGLVTSTESGLAVPDWPLSYGTMFPPMVGGIRYEHSHRLIAGLVLILTLILTAWIYAKDRRPALQRTIAVMLGAVLVQALLGGITVLYKLPTTVSVLHACLGQIFFALSVLLLRMAGPRWESRQFSSVIFAPAMRWATALLTVGLLIQLGLGAWARHTGGDHVMIHAGWGLTLFLWITIVSFISAEKYRSDAMARWHGLGLWAVSGIQILLGFAAFYHTIMKKSDGIGGWGEIGTATLHQTTGALLLAMSLVLAVHMNRRRPTISAEEDIAAAQ